jgi:hypothetical protein
MATCEKCGGIMKDISDIKTPPENMKLRCGNENCRRITFIRVKVAEVKQKTPEKSAKGGYCCGMAANDISAEPGTKKYFCRVCSKIFGDAVITVADI